jgi:hypothetical protein
MQDKENMDPEVIKQTVSELQQSSLKVTGKLFHHFSLHRE